MPPDAPGLEANQSFTEVLSTPTPGVLGRGAAATLKDVYGSPRSQSNTDILC